MAASQMVKLPPAHFVPMRLDKFLSQFTSMSRKDIENIYYADRSRIQIRTHPVMEETAAPAVNPSPSLHALVYLEEDHVLVDGQEIDWQRELERLKTRVVALNKPGGAISALKSDYGKKTLNACLQGMPEGFGCIGRLDKDTTGLLMFTNDGDLGHVITKKGNRISKIYELTIAEADLTLDDPRIQQMLQGVDLYKGEEPARAAHITIHHPQTTDSSLSSTTTTTATTATATATPAADCSGQEEGPHKRKGLSESSAAGDDGDREAKRRREEKKEKEKEEDDVGVQGGEGRGEEEKEEANEDKKEKVSKKRRKLLARGTTTKLSLEIREGRNRVIRRMCARVRLPLLHLHRVRIGNIDLDDVGLTGRLGEWRFVDEEKIEELWQMVGGRDEAVTRQQVVALASRLRRARDEAAATAAGATAQASADADSSSADASAGLERLEAWFARHRLLTFVDGQQQPTTEP